MRGFFEYEQHILIEKLEKKYLEYALLSIAQVTNSGTGRRISHGYNPASFMTIRISP